MGEVIGKLWCWQESVSNLKLKEKTCLSAVEEKAFDQFRCPSDVLFSAQRQKTILVSL